MRRPAAVPPAPPLVLRIDALVLRGVGRADAAGIAHALQAELARRLAAPGPAAWRPEAAAVLRVQMPAPAAGARPAAIGRQLGGALAGALLSPAPGKHGDRR